MEKPKVLVTCDMLPPWPEILSQHCDVETVLDDNLTKDKIIKLLKDKDGLICLVSDKIDAEIINTCSQLKVISTYSVGYDHIDLSSATKNGIYVTNTPDVLTDATADLTWALLMSIARRIAESDKYVRDNKWKIAWAPKFMVGGDIFGQTLGIIGMGRIGQAVAKRAQGFNMKILYYDMFKPNPKIIKDLNLQYKNLDELLQESDFICLHVALNKDTHHIINKQKLKLMKSSAYLINASRGPVVDQKALTFALKNKIIAGAGLDVYEKEPIESNDPLLHLSNVVLAPHIGSGSITSRTKMAELAVNNLIYILQGKPPLSLVNEKVLSIKSLSNMCMI